MRKVELQWKSESAARTDPCSSRVQFVARANDGLSIPVVEQLDRSALVFTLVVCYDPTYLLTCLLTYLFAPPVVNNLPGQTLVEWRWWR
jgi:hypothetical protein